ncbi:ankyrin repeat containing protein [Fusarium heterosporum]|uniref:Ankyrin repeat containing protein n=1 Tax=Fusarium heterosporum TaxID=42747 RepID=A0A8H5SVH2_FUSHE|nr:ankyrin repeat containing protein [Fusarium heterosporum]
MGASSQPRAHEENTPSGEPPACSCGKSDFQGLVSFIAHARECPEVHNSARAKNGSIGTGRCVYGCDTVCSEDQVEHFICKGCGKIFTESNADRSCALERINPAHYFLGAAEVFRKPTAEEMIHKAVKAMGPSCIMSALRDINPVCALMYFDDAVKKYHPLASPEPDAHMAMANGEIAYQERPVESLEQKSERAENEDLGPSPESTVSAPTSNQGFPSASDSQAVTQRGLFMLAMAGDIRGLDELFRKKLASPRDVSFTRNENLVRWTLRGGLNNHECARWLFDQGATIDKDSFDHVHDFMAGRKCSDEDARKLQFIRYSHHDDWLEEQNFPNIHKIILRIYEGKDKDLCQVLKNKRDEVIKKDNLGRTALDWATARGDVHNMKLLLRYGSPYNNIDKEGRSTLQHAIESHDLEAVQTLLQHGANPNPPIPTNLHRSSPLSSASFGGLEEQARLLLQQGANANSRNPEGRTPLHQAAMNNNVGCAEVLLPYIDLNTEFMGPGPNALTAAVTQNSHGVLLVLVTCCVKNGVIPSADLLPIIAEHADLETMNRLSLLAPLQCDTAVARCREALSERDGFQPEWDQAFLRLVAPTVGDDQRMS